VTEKPRLRPDPSAWTFEAWEQELAVVAVRDLNFLKLARLAAATLADALARVPAPETTEPLAASAYRQLAALQLGALAVRSTLGLAVLVSNGYEVEAHGLKRRLSEVFNRAQLVADDPSGEQARRWLEGRDAGTHGRVAQKVGALDSWQFLSVSTHADSGGIAFISSPPGWNLAYANERVINLKPHRFPRHANRLLFDAAFESGAILGLLAEVFGAVVEVPPALSQGLLAAKQQIEAADRNAGGEPD